jgi:succinate-semialdehyde dehydrogenase
MQSSGFSTVNPSTGEQIESFSFYNSSEIEEVLVRAEKSFQSFRKLPVHRRAELLSHLAETLRKNKAKLAKVITTEMGKILPEAEAEVEKCASEADWYAEHGPQMLADAPAPTGRVNAYVSYLPLGPILAIMPWNFPIWQLTRMALPTMLAGNVVLVKHSHNTQRSSLEFERVVQEAGFPEGVFQNLILRTEDIVDVINDPRVQGASVTGSVRASSAVASEAGKVIKKTVIELGGSDAFIVCEDADIPKAVEAGIRGRFHNAGQVCLAAKRFIRRLLLVRITLGVSDPEIAFQLKSYVQEHIVDYLNQFKTGSLVGAVADQKPPVAAPEPIENQKLEPARSACRAA